MAEPGKERSSDKVEKGTPAITKKTTKEGIVRVN